MTPVCCVLLWQTAAFCPGLRGCQTGPWKGEFPFDPTHGTDYTRIAGKKARELAEDEVPEVIRDAVLQETTVSEVDSVEYNLSGRSLEVSVTGTLTTGGVITTEVSTL